jgi:hypothetical protein
VPTPDGDPATDLAELDPATPVAAAREIADALPEGSARLEVVEGAGHFPWKDAPDRYWPLVTGFVTTPRTKPPQLSRHGAEGPAQRVT